MIVNFKPITVRQQQTLDYIKKFIAEKGYSPSVSEIGKGIFSSSPSTILGLLCQLEYKGYIERLPKRARSIRIVGQQADPRDQPIKELLDFMDSLYQLTNDPITKEQIRIAAQKAREAV